MPYTVPNQRIVKIHRETPHGDFLGIKNENWKKASRDLGAHALRLYLYFAANANNYELALSPAAIREEIGIPRSTYTDQFRILVDRGYLLHTGGNRYEFFETPQSSADINEKNTMTANVQSNKKGTSDGIDFSKAVNKGAVDNREINNKYSPPNRGINNPREKEYFFPKEDEIENIDLFMEKFEF